MVIDLNRWEVRLRGEQIHMKPREFDLLIFLARNQGMVLARDLILERVWGWEYDGDSRTVSVHMRWLREKLEVDPANPTRLVTVRGVGYRFGDERSGSGIWAWGSGYNFASPLS